MRKSFLKKMSKKRQEILSEEAIIVKLLLEQCQGRCMICGKLAPLEKNHTRDRKRFVMSCRQCHQGGTHIGNHRYLDEEVKDV